MVANAKGALVRTRVGDMRVPRQNHVDSAMPPLRQRPPCAERLIARVPAQGDIQRMMHHHYFERRLGSRAKMPPHGLNLHCVNSPAFPRESTAGVDPNHGNRRVNVEVLDVLADVLAESRPFRNETPVRIVERHVMVAWDDDLRMRKPLQEVPRLLEFRSLCSLCEVTGDRQHQDSRYWLDSSAIKRDVGWEPQISWEEGMSEMVDWGRKYLPLLKTLPTDFVMRA